MSKLETRVVVAVGVVSKVGVVKVGQCGHVISVVTSKHSWQLGNVVSIIM